MILKERFEAQPWADLLAHRKATTLLMLEHFKSVAALGLNQIIETGTARTRDNWQGDGQSTLVWDFSEVGLLYLDSLDFDWSSGDTSAQHHLAELNAVWERLPSGCLIVIDDRHSPSQGKHTAIAAFMSEKQIESFFTDYQIGWIKP